MTGRRRPLDAAAVVLALGLLTGCSDAPAPPPAPSPAQTSTPTLSATTATPTATIPPPPLLPAAATTPDQAGAEAFFRYFWDVYTWSYLAGDARAIRAISTADCRFCTSTAEGVEDAAAKTLVTSDGKVTVDSAAATFGDPAKGLSVLGVIDQQAAVQRDRAGTVVWQGAALTDQGVNAVMSFGDGAWLMTAVDILEQTP